MSGPATLAGRGVVVRGAADRQRADEWALALASEGISSRMVATPAGWVLLVAEAQGRRAVSVLDAYDDENRPRESSATLAAGALGIRPRLVAVALALVAFHVALRGSGVWESWVSAGSSAAGAITAGEVWRSVTAVTLHADAGHVLANAAFGLLFATVLARDLGDGVTLALMLAAGVGANLSSAAIVGSGRTSIGASTAVFGAVGILVGRAAVRAGAGRSAPGGKWIALGSGAALLALLGTAARADILGHFLGFAAGIPLGAVAEGLARRGRLPSGVVAATAAATVVIGAWWLALR